MDYSIEIVSDKANSAISDQLYLDTIDKVDAKFIISKLLVNSKDFKTNRRAKQIINQYAVTKLPFILISENKIGKTAVYSEEMPITIERIITKINEEIN